MHTEHLPSIIIRDIREISELLEVEQVQKDVWGIADREVFPALALVPMIELGAVLVGAFDGDRMAAFVFGFPGLEDGRVILHSDMLAVRPDYRSHGLGYKLKLAQRERALAKGIDTITWTFDPLQSLNAHLNFEKLGVTANRYSVNYYGQTTSFLHRTGTDRLWVTWLLNSKRVHDRIAYVARSESFVLGDIPAVVRLGENEEPVTSPPENPGRQFLAIEIPDNINLRLKENPEQAIRWREATRKAFTNAMSAGFMVKEFYRLKRGDGYVGIYLLTSGTRA
jgi:predicted GNAT superfamily acetyltransferase